MTHSVSHNLILELNGNDLTVVVLNKDNCVLEIQFYPLVDVNILTDILLKLPEIYSDIALLVRKNSFITIPESFYGSDLNRMFELSYSINEANKLELDKTDFGIGVLYTLDITLLDLILAKFPRIKIRNEATIILNKVYREIGLRQTRILISINNDMLLLFAISEGKLELCNSYSVKSNDDIFYFVMLAIEQLHFSPIETELVILGEPPMRSEIFDLFKNYIKEINIWMEKVQIGDTIENQSLLNHSFALQNLLCE